MDKAATLLLFGATGDLARRMLLPSLYGLDADGLLPEQLAVIGTARTDLTDEDYRQRALEALQQHLPEGFYRADVAERFLKRLRYVAVDAGRLEDFPKLAGAVGDCGPGLAIFLSTAPSLIGPT